MKLLLSSIFVFCLTFQTTAQCYFSATGDSVLLVNSYSYSKDSHLITYFYNYDIFIQGDSKYTTHLVGNYQGEYSDSINGKSIPDFHFPDSILTNFGTKARSIYQSQIDSIVDVDLNIVKIKRLKYVQGGCSKGCSWESYYKMRTNFTLSIWGDEKRTMHLDTLYFIDRDYIGWGEKPKNKGASHFRRNPFDCMLYDFYWSEKFQKHFMTIHYSTKRITEKTNPNQYNRLTYLFD